MSNVQILNNLAAWRERLIAQDIDPDRRLLWVDVSSQSLFVCEAGEITGQFPVSTALKGTGCDENSFQTPIGLHRISEKIGDGVQPGMVFKGRQATGELAEVEQADRDTGHDHITSRVLWLTGMQRGINQGEGVDTHDRYIYIHGTNEEGRIGQAVSHGCIRLKNRDVITLYEQVEEGTAVIIDG
ncbi:MAG: L,D-transpeptidase [Gammaproteobacteria bacterium]|nr:L,D-transpeptidase [Gammaproteobacteria bacterium]